MENLIKSRRFYKHALIERKISAIEFDASVPCIDMMIVESFPTMHALPLSIEMLIACTPPFAVLFPIAFAFVKTSSAAFARRALSISVIVCPTRTVPFKSRAMSPSISGMSSINLERFASNLFLSINHPTWLMLAFKCYDIMYSLLV